MIKSLSIKNFRGLDGLKVEEFGRVNLITGANNVGKTALLEAIGIAALAPYPYPIAVYHSRRIAEKNIDSVFLNAQMPFWEYLFSNKDMSRPIQFEFLTETTELVQIEAVVDYRKKQTILNDLNYVPAAQALLDINDIHVLKITRESTEKEDTSFMVMDKVNIRVFGDKPKERVHYYSTDHRGRREEDNKTFTDVNLRNYLDAVLSVVQVIDPEVTQLEILERGHAQLWATKGGLKLPLTQLGDGLSRFLSILLGVYAEDSGYILIDEIETGLHHSTLQAMWSAIRKAAIAVDVQIFATTHSEECIEAANAVFSEPDLQKDFRFHRLQKINNMLTVSSYGTDILGNALDMGLELRGQTMVRVP